MGNREAPRSGQNALPCPECGTLTPIEHAFCSRCGTQLGTAVPPQHVPIPAQPTSQAGRPSPLRRFVLPAIGGIVGLCLVCGIIGNLVGGTDTTDSTGQASTRAIQIPLEASAEATIEPAAEPSTTREPTATIEPTVTLEPPTSTAEPLTATPEPPTETPEPPTATPEPIAEPTAVPEPPTAIPEPVVTERCD